MSPINMQKLESGIRLGAALLERINNHKIDAIMKLFDDNCVMEPFLAGSAGARLIGKVETRKYFELLLAGRSNLHYSTEEILGFGHRCIIRWSCSWQDGAGARQSLRGVDIIREKNDLICEILSYGKLE